MPRVIGARAGANAVVQRRLCPDERRATSTAVNRGSMREVRCIYRAEYNKRTAEGIARSDEDEGEIDACQ